MKSRTPAAAAVWASLVALPLFLFAGTAQAQTLDGWTQTASYGAGALRQQSCVTAVGSTGYTYIYCVGGVDALGIFHSDVYMSQLTPTGVTNPQRTPDQGAWVQLNSYFQNTVRAPVFYPTPIAGHSCVTSGGLIYCVGGNTGAGATSAVYYAPLNESIGPGLTGPDVGIGKWRATTNYPDAVDNLSCVTDSGFIYCVGGHTPDSFPNDARYLNDVRYASLSSAGVGPWQSADGYPNIGGINGTPGVAGTSCTVGHDVVSFVYCVGGFTKSGTFGDVNYAQLLASGGTRDGWHSASTYPNAYDFVSCATAAGYLYCVGGEDNVNRPKPDVNYALMDPAGPGTGLGSWHATSAYPTFIGVVQHSCVGGFPQNSTVLPSYGLFGNIYCVGGLTGSGPTDRVYYASAAVHLRDRASCARINGSWNEGSRTCTTGSYANSGILQVETGVTLSIPASGTFTNYGRLFNAGMIQIDGMLQNLVVPGSPTEQGSIDNQGVIEVLGGLNNDVVIRNYSQQASTTNPASVNIRSNGVLTNGGSLLNGGVVNNNGVLGSAGFVANYFLIINSGQMTNTNTFENRDQIENSGTFTNNGTLLTYAVDGVARITNKAGGSLVNSRTFTNSGLFANSGAFGQRPGAMFTNTYQMTNAGSIENAPTATFANSGSFKNASSGNLLNFGLVSNTGVIDNDAGGAILNGANTPPATINNNSGATINNSGTLRIAPGAASNAGSIFNSCTGVIVLGPGVTITGNQPLDACVPVAPTVTVSGGPVFYNGTGQSATCTVTGTNGAGVPGECVLTYNGSTALPIDAATYQVSASFTSTARTYTNATGSGSFTIDKATPHVSVPDTSVPYDGTAHSVAPCTATGVSAESVPGTCAITYNDSATAPTDAGVYRIRGSFTSGHANYANAIGNGTLVVLTVSQSITSFDPPPDRTFGDPAFALTATASSGLPVSFSSAPPDVCTVNGATVTIVGGGSCVIVASQPGNGNYLPAPSVTRSFTVAPAAQIITFLPLPDVSPTLRGLEPITLTATASSGLAVEYSTDVTLGVCSVSGTTLSLLRVGTCTVAAFQRGNRSYSAAVPATRTFVINKLPQIITFARLSDVPFAVGGVSIPLSATASSGLPVTFSMSPPAVCQQLGAGYWLVAAGTCTVTADQGGSLSYLAARSVSRTFEVTPIPATITFGPIGKRLFGVSPFDVAARANASEAFPITFTTTTPAVCVVASSLVRIKGIGTCSLTAGAKPGSNYTAPPVHQSFEVTLRPSGTLAAGGTPLDVGKLPRALATGDFNADGKSDLAIAVSGSGLDSAVTVLLGDGAGGFAPGPGSPLPIGRYPSSIVAADMDGDGHLDLVIAGGENTILLMGDGAGGFARGTPTFPPGSAIVADFNGDGRLDIVRLNLGDDGAVVLLNGGPVSATWIGPGFQSGEFIATGHLPISAVAGDFNGDGAVDLAVTNSGSDNVAVELGDGNGHFSPAPGTSIQFAPGSYPAGIVTGDFNGDNNLDLAIALAGSNNISVWLGNGAGGFTAAPPMPVGAVTGPFWLTAGDFNGDGKADLAVANNGASTITVLLGDGTGQFAVGGKFAAGGNPYPIAVADFNGDGRTDLVTANDSKVIVLLGASAPTNSVLSTASPLTLTLGQDATLTLAVSNTGSAFASATGTATLFDGGVAIATAPESTSPYPFTASNLPLGIHTLTASYAGDKRSLASVSNAVVVQVIPRAQTITFPAIADKTFGDAPFVVGATASSGLAVGFSILSGPATIAVNTITLTGAGPVVVRASQPGNAIYDAAPTVDRSFTVLNPLPVFDHLGVNSMVKVNPPAATPVRLDVFGSGFAPGSIARWNGSDLATTFIGVDHLEAAVPAALLGRRGVAYVTVFNPAPGGGTSALKEFFITDSPTLVLDAATRQIAGGPLVVSSGGTGPGTPGSITVEAVAVGAAAVTVGHYAADPAAPVTFNSGGQFFDVFVAPGSAISSLTITTCTAGANLAFWFDGLTWQLASDQTYNAVTGCVAVTVNAHTAPTVAQLTGTYFAAAIDWQAPSTTATASTTGGPYVLGSWTNKSVVVTLNAKDEPGGSGVATLIYAVNGAMTTIHDATASVPIIADGESVITFHATDRAGNAETEQRVVVKIDRIPPTLSLPAPIVAEADRPSGAPVSFTATATDPVDGANPVTCTPSSGAVFPLGDTLVSCSVSDAAGNVATGSFRVTVRDTTPPVITSISAAPPVLTPDGDRVVVTISVKASDLVDPAPLCKITSVTSSDPDETHGQHGENRSDPDWRILGNLKVSLKAENSGDDKPFFYTIGVTCSDAAHNQATASIKVPLSSSRHDGDDKRVGDHNKKEQRRDVN
jgi:hypothetical protein